jgi:hypothetical protein
MGRQFSGQRTGERDVRCGQVLMRAEFSGKGLNSPKVWRHAPCV